MLEQLTEVVSELLPLAGRMLAALLVTTLGLGLEINAVQTWVGGETTLALWFTFMGCVALYAGFNLFKQANVIEQFQTRM